MAGSELHWDAFSLRARQEGCCRPDAVRWGIRDWLPQRAVPKGCAEAPAKVSAVSLGNVEVYTQENLPSQTNEMIHAVALGTASMRRESKQKDPQCTCSVATQGTSTCQMRQMRKQWLP